MSLSCYFKKTSPRITPNAAIIREESFRQRYWKLSNILIDLHFGKEWISYKYFSLLLNLGTKVAVKLTDIENKIPQNVNKTIVVLR